jgi:hypothetical protein
LTLARKAHHSSRQCKRRNYVTDGHTFAELKCVSERLIFGECFATKLRLFLFRLPASLAERSINVGGGSFLAESFFLALRLSFRSIFLGIKNISRFTWLSQYREYNGITAITFRSIR